MPNCITHFVRHGFTEAVVFQQMMLAVTRATGNNWKHPDLTFGQYHKVEAAPSPDEGLRWDRAKIARRRSYQPYGSPERKKGASFDKDDFITFAPYGGTNSQGNLWLARILLGPSQDYELQRQDLQEFCHLFAIPWHLMMRELSASSPSKVAQLLQASLNTALPNATNPDKTGRIGVAAGTDLQFREPQGTACKILIDAMMKNEGIVHRMLLGNEMSSTTQDTGPAGSSQLAGKEEDKYITAYGRLVCEAIAPPLIAWIDRENAAAEFPKLEEGESELWLRFQPEGMRHTVGLPERTPEPMLNVMDKAPEEEGLDEDDLDTEEESDDVVELHQLELGWVTINGVAVHIDDEGKIDKGPAAMRGKAPADIDEGDVSGHKGKLTERAESADRAAKNAERRVAKRKKALKNWPEGSERRKQIEALIEADAKIAKVQREIAATHRSRALKLAMVISQTKRHTHLLLAKPRGLILPPVHPNCRCFIVENGVVISGWHSGTGARSGIEHGAGFDLDDGWHDAQDARVCAECRAYGAFYNAMERGDVRLSPEEREALLDARNSKDYKSALERDAASEVKAIEIASEHDRDGLLAQSIKTRGVTPSSAELFETVDNALDVSRSAADVRGGTTIGTGPDAFTLPDAVIASRVPFGPGRMVLRPSFVGAVIAAGPNYSVVTSLGRTKVITRGARAHVVATEDSWWLALLIFAELERRRRKQNEERRLEREPVAQ
jgi:hypothetical protein